MNGASPIVLSRTSRALPVHMPAPRSRSLEIAAVVIIDLGGVALSLAHHSWIGAVIFTAHLAISALLTARTAGRPNPTAQREPPRSPPVLLQSIRRSEFGPN